MKLFGIFFLILFFFLFRSVYAQTGNIDSSRVQTLRIDPQTARGAKVSELFREVEFIPLETTKQSLFGRISQLEIIDGMFAILDFDTKSILLFTGQGAFKTKISIQAILNDTQGKESLTFSGFRTIVEDGQPLIVVTTNKHKIYFDLAGKQLKKLLFKDAAGANDLTLGLHTFVRPGFKKNSKDTLAYEFGIISKTDTLTYFPYSINRSRYDEYLGSAYRFYDYGKPDELLYNNYYSNHFYRITPMGVSMAYRVILPAEISLPKDFSSNPAFKMKRTVFFEKNPGVVRSLSNVLMIGNMLYFTLNKWRSEKSDKRNIIYNLTTAEVISLQDIEPDARSFFLPVNDGGSNFTDFNSNGFHDYHQGYLYTSYSSTAIFTFKAQNSDRNITYPPLLDRFFKTQNTNSNPVIVKLRPTP